MGVYDVTRSVFSTHSESFGVIRWPECDCVCAGVGLSGGRGRLLTHVHRASACTLNAVGLLPVSGCGDARVAPPCPTTLCVWRNLPYLTLPYSGDVVECSLLELGSCRSMRCGWDVGQTETRNLLGEATAAPLLMLVFAKPRR